MTNIKKTKKGFTLMEMVTVVAIVAIVSTAGFVGVAVTLTNARNTQSRLSTENGYNFESEARESVKYIVPIGAHAAVEYYTPDGGEPNNEQTGNNNPATPNNDDTTTPGGGGSGNGGSVIPADGGSPAPATENDPPITENDPPVTEDDPPATPADNSGDSGNSGDSDNNDVISGGGNGTPAPGTSVSRSSGGGYDYWENGHIVGYYHQNQGTISFGDGVQSAIIVVPEGTKGFQVNNDGKYTVTPLGNNRYQVDFTATWQTNKDTTLRISHDYLGANNTDYGTEQIYVESYTT